ncbi:hypothetical protein Q31b_29080 [Novipirellula aureliae]|uniref:Uncharacterized protein n=1 Tax=Novipirellula aureliae TaxID=2527966 RepID=A0A5C6E1C5_9BACT|nr:hypothetical protein Q31b_29080 [Novipirellula aureliae]
MGLQIVLLTSTPSSVYVHCSKDSLRISRFGVSGLSI